jgi:hypothetical protein
MVHSLIREQLALYQSLHQVHVFSPNNSILRGFTLRNITGQGRRKKIQNTPWLGSGGRTHRLSDVLPHAHILSTRLDSGLGTASSW